MNYTKGYYSLIQYCPDESRAESVNLGVVLFCPDRAFLDVITSPSNERVRKFFGSGTFSTQRLNDAKAALENRLRREQGAGIRTQEEFLNFVHSRANDLLLTAPRPLKVANPEQELTALYRSLVLEHALRAEPKAITPPIKPVRKSQLTKQLNNLFRRPKVQKARVEKPSVIVPVAGTRLTTPYGFQNGKLNLIVSLQFNTNTSRRARELALEGDLLRKYEDEMENPAALWITLPVPEDEAREEEREQVEALFREYELPVFREENFDDLEQQVEAIIH